MPDIETLDILTINCNTIGTHKLSGQATSKQTDESSYTNKTQNTEPQRQCNTNTDISISMNANPTVTDNNSRKINYFLPGPSQYADRRASAKITQ